MSEKFGLDWWKQDAQRMILFMELMRAEAKVSENKGHEEPKFRARM